MTPLVIIIITPSSFAVIRLSRRGGCLQKKKVNHKFLWSCSVKGSDQWSHGALEKLDSDDDFYFLFP